MQLDLMHAPFIQPCSLTYYPAHFHSTHPAWYKTQLTLKFCICSLGVVVSMNSLVKYDTQKYRVYYKNASLCDCFAHVANLLWCSHTKIVPPPKTDNWSRNQVVVHLCKRSCKVACAEASIQTFFLHIDEPSSLLYYAHSNTYYYHITCMSLYVTHVNV